MMITLKLIIKKLSKSFKYKISKISYQNKKFERELFLK